jgi:hypothetical protein
VSPKTDLAAAAPPTAAAPPRSADDLGVRVEVPAVPRLLWLALAVGVLCDLALRSGAASLGGAFLVVGTSAALLVSGRLRTRTSQVLVAVAPLFGVWLAIRMSEWLLPLDVLVAFGLLVLGTSLSSGGSLFELSVPVAAQRLAVSVLHGCGVPGFLRPVATAIAARAGRNGGAVPALRGVVLAVPVVVVLGALLASADAVFAAIFRIEADTGDLVLHAFLITLGAWVLLGLLRTASAEPVRPRGGIRARLGRTEVTVVLGSVVLLFGAFAGAQLVALSEGGQKVLDTAGLTYAEYARSGFFQLLWVAALTVALLLGLRPVVADDEVAPRRFRVLGEVVVVLTLVIVATAVRRLGLYKDAFGLTMLRLYSTVFALWVGGVIVGVGLVIAGVRRDRHWLPGAALVSALVGLFGLNLVNPEALVARHNLDRLAQGREVDAEYLAEGLALDAVPTIVDRLPTLDPMTQADLLARIGCPERGDGWAGWNASRSAAADAVGEGCVDAASAWED